MLGCLEGSIRKRDRKVDSSGVTFKFGNDGVLQSTYAVLLPRKIGGWIKVEVIPCNTPFLLSNSLLRKVKGVVDVEGRKLMFKGVNFGIHLVECRKHLLGLSVHDLLNGPWKDLQILLENKEATRIHTPEITRDGQPSSMHEQWNSECLSQQPHESCQDSHSVNDGLSPVRTRSCPSTSQQYKPTRSKHSVIEEDKEIGKATACIQAHRPRRPTEMPDQ